MIIKKNQSGCSGQHHRVHHLLILHPHPVQLKVKHKVPDFQQQVISTLLAHHHRVFTQEPLISLQDQRSLHTLVQHILHMTHCLLRQVQAVDGLILGIQAPPAQPLVTSHHHHTRAHTPEVHLHGNHRIHSQP